MKLKKQTPLKAVIEQFSKKYSGKVIIAHKEDYIGAVEIFENLDHIESRLKNSLVHELKIYCNYMILFVSW